MYRRTLVFCVGCLLMNATFSQSPLDSSISAYSTKYEQEKIHIHFDKDAYLPGETVWMKAYLLSGSKPSYISRNIYFDWTDARGHLLLHSVSPVSEGAASSSFVIPEAVDQGVVHVKVYTQWMLNFDEAFLYNKDIPVLTPSGDLNENPEKIKTEIRFFAEGGDLVNGVNSVLAFEALDQHGRPVSVYGAIKNAKNSIVDSFRTSYRGMGYCHFKPDNSKQYNAVWKDASGEVHSTPLPQSKPNGIVLHMSSHTDDQIQYNLERSVDAVTLNRVTVMGMIDQKVVYKSNLSLTNNRAEGAISTSSFPCGVMTLTVFDGTMAPIAERVIFIRNTKSFARTQLKQDQVNLNKRGRNEISLEIPDSLTTSLSVSVTDGGLGSDSSNNIYSDVLLSSELRGYINDPASYLEDSAEGNDHLNLLLLTHGWRRFNWENAVAGRFPQLKYLHDGDFLTLKGEMHGTAGLDAEDSIALLMISRDKKKQVISLPVNTDGKFNQRGLFFYDSVQIVYRFNHASKINGNSEISLYSDLLPPLTPAKAVDPAFSWLRVPDVVLEKELNGNIVETNSYAIPSQDMAYILTPKTDGSRPATESATHYLSTMFAELRFPATLKEQGNVGDGRLTSYSPAGHSVLKSNVNISYDGSPVAMDDLKTISMKEVLFLKFVPKTSPKGLPTLAITSRQSLAQSSILDNKTGFAVVTGYTPAREFYAPRYGADKVSDFAASDFRSTLYWNPAVRLDRSHRKVSLVFYNNDVSTKFRVVVEGMNQEGKLTRIEEFIK